MKDEFLKGLVKKSFLLYTKDTVPESILTYDTVSTEFFSIFKAGKRRLFLSLKESQPRTYEAIMKCDEVFLLERKMIKGKGRVYSLCFDFDDYLVTSNLINPRLLERRRKAKKILPAQLTYLPIELQCYYYNFDALSLLINGKISYLRNQFLPRTMNDFITLKNETIEYALDVKDEALNSFGSHYVWINTGTHLILISPNPNQSRAICYEIQSNVSTPITNLTEFVDCYVSNVLRFGRPLTKSELNNVLGGYL